MFTKLVAFGCALGCTVFFSLNLKIKRRRRSYTDALKVKPKVPDEDSESERSELESFWEESFKEQPKDSISYQDLEQHRVIGTGQFGVVRVARHVPTGEVYALKTMRKSPILAGKPVEHTVNERIILEEVRSKFCVGLVGAFQDSTNLYLLQEWIPGGDLFHHMELKGVFDEPSAVFYAANVLLAMEHLHSRGVVHRDLKPENLLLDKNGYLKVVDFGFAKRIDDDCTFTVCGTPDYQAPETIMQRGTQAYADYWALGIIIYEMLVGTPPFESETGNIMDTFERIVAGKFYVPPFVSAAAADLIRSLLKVSPEHRLGCGAGGSGKIKEHTWFSNVDWEALEEQLLPAPIQPQVSDPLDTSNFDNFDVGKDQVEQECADTRCWGSTLWSPINDF